MGVIEPGIAGAAQPGDELGHGDSPRSALLDISDAVPAGILLVDASRRITFANEPAGLAQRLRALRPGLEVLFMSGYNDSRLVDRSSGEQTVNLIRKPFTPADLIRQVGQLADNGT